MLDELRQAVFDANLELARSGLVTLTWGNVSGIDRKRGLVVIKPSGVPYSALRAEDLVVVDLDARRVEGTLNPSSDMPTHVRLYRAFDGTGGIVHTHSTHAVAFAQAGRELPCLGTTHADHFSGTVPLTRQLSKAEVEDDYVGNTAAVIIERFSELDPRAVPAVLVPGHGPFAWGTDAADAVKNSIALEAVARMALDTFRLEPDAAPIPAYLLRKHYRRKHGPDATYGQQG